MLKFDYKLPHLTDSYVALSTEVLDLQSSILFLLLTWQNILSIFQSLKTFQQRYNLLYSITKSLVCLQEGADLLCIDNRLLIQRTLVKCADISNACRPLELCKEWAARIAEEYFSQTKEEKERKLHVVFPDFERQTCNLPGTQVLKL